jgi:hypothetical protein
MRPAPRSLHRGLQLWPMPDAVQHDEATKIGEVTAHRLRAWLRYEVQPVKCAYQKHRWLSNFGPLRSTLSHVTRLPSHGSSSAFHGIRCV